MNSQQTTTTYRIALLAVVITLLTVATGCTVSSQTKTITNAPPPTLTSIAVTAANSTLTVDDTEQLTATGTYSDKSTKDLTSSVSWSATPTGIVTISAAGMLSATSSGTVSVTATMNSISGSFNVTINPKLVSLAVTPSSASIAMQTTQQFTATGTFSDGSKQNITGSVTWSASPTGIATISTTAPTQGLAAAVAPGTTTIKATSGSISNTASLTVTSATPTGLAITPNPATMSLDVSQQFTATATFSDSTTQDVSNVAQWSSSSPTNATVTGTGLVTAKAITSSPITISATFASQSANTQLTINADSLVSIAITPGGGIAQGMNTQFTATGTFNDGSTHNVTSQITTWSSTDSTVLQFQGGSRAKGLKPGTVTVSATLGSVTGRIPFDVSNATIQSVTVTPSGSVLPIGGHETFTATGVFSDSSTQDITTSVTWSSDSAHATIGSSGATLGIANGISAGTANISAMFTGGGVSKTGTAPLTVSSATLTSLALTPGSSLVVPGSTMQYNAVGTWSDQSTEVLNSAVTWSIADVSGSNVATVNTAGVVTGNTAGTATVKAVINSLNATASVVVEGSALTGIQVTPSSTSIPETIDVQFTAKGSFADGKTLDLTAAVTWTSSSSAIATVSNVANTSGVATGNATGTATISAVFLGQSDSAALTVTNATLNSITVTPANSSISLGNTQQFAAKGAFSDSSVITLTNQVNWTSSDPQVAVIKPTGIADSASTGTTTIKASLNGVSGSTVLTVH
ncbi:MAG TPA: Ig-like domain-containing protein [Terriglobales bacterium]|nr:Ig-like domain-containing protein [Terriglobales bacterium]